MKNDLSITKDIRKIKRVYYAVEKLEKTIETPQRQERNKLLGERQKNNRKNKTSLNREVEHNVLNHGNSVACK